ncbi:MAG TPA: hypothetical protein VGI64_19595 [Streptosporangiaceae bacterium]|jgi:hypothetical protein
MRTGLTVEHRDAAQVEAVARSAEREEGPGRWRGAGCALAGLTEGGTVRREQLTELADRYGVADVMLAAEADGHYDAAGEAERQRLREHCVYTSLDTMAAYQYGGYVPGPDGEYLGRAWVYASYLGLHDDESGRARLHTHNLLLLIPAGELEAMASSRRAD